MTAAFPANNLSSVMTGTGHREPRQLPWTGMAGGLLILVAVILLASGLLPVASAIDVAERTWSILLFVVAATVVAELAAAAGVFDAVADRLGKAAAGRVVVLWLLVVALAVVATVFLSLDTTAVLLTPVVVLMARGRGLNALPFALTTIWLANTGSLLFPMSNLTNLLAAHTLGLDAWEFAALMAPAAIVGVLVPVAVIGVWQRRAVSGPLAPAESQPLEDRTLTLGAGIIVAALLPALVSGLPVWLPACVAALMLGVLVAVRKPAALSWSLFPWQIVVLAVGLFLVVETAHAHGLSDGAAPFVGQGTSFLALLRLAASGALLANGIDNLPAYLALEPLALDPLRMAALLVGANAGALVTPWASLAILLWHERLTGLGVRLRWPIYMAASLVVAIVTVTLAVAALSLAHS